MNTFTMTDDQVDRIVISELKYSYELCCRLDKDEGGWYIDPDWELMESIEKVLSYFMPPADYREWLKEATLCKLSMTSELIADQ